MSYQRIKLKTGEVVVPGNYIIIKSTISPDADYAGIITATDGTLPMYLFLSKIPVKDMNEEEERAIIRICGKSHPEIKAVYDQEIEPDIDGKGRLLNKKEWLNAPGIMVYAVKEVPSMDELNRDTGIIRNGGNNYEI